jgi:hypothetical protein
MYKGIVATLLLFVSHCMANGYKEPKPAGFGIKMDNVSLPAANRKEFASRLATFVKARPAKFQVFLAPKVLALALLLDPTNKDAVVLNGQLLRNVQTQVEDGSRASHLSDRIVTFSKKLIATKKEDDLKLAAHLVDFAITLTPDHADAMYIYQLNKLKGRVNWKPVLGVVDPKVAGKGGRVVPKPGLADPKYRKIPKKYEKRQAKIKGLFVTITERGMSGEAMDILATVKEHTQMRTFIYGFARRDIGREMRIALDEALKVVQNRYPFLQGGSKVEFSFRNKYVPKDGGSAGTAFALLFLSLVDGITLDETFAVTGDVSVDWKVLQVGGVPAKIQGATDGKLANVVVPISNERSVYDLLLLKSWRSIWTINIFTAKDVTEAMETIRVDRTPERAKGMKLWVKVQAHLNKHGLKGLTPKVYTALKIIRKGLPNSLSVRMLMEYREKKLKYTKLSLRSSVEETIQRNPIAFRMLFQEEWTKQKFGNGQPAKGVLVQRNSSFYNAVLNNIKEKDLSDCRSKAAKIQRKLPPEVRKLSELMVEVNKNAEKYLKYKKGLNKASSSKALYETIVTRKLPRTIQTARKELDRLSKDDKFLKKMSAQ